MKQCCILLAIIVFCFAGRLPANIDYIDGESGHTPSRSGLFRTLISPVGDIRAILGPQGKSICVSGDGKDIAVIYGDPTPDPDNYMEVKIAYSVDAGTTWTTYGPYSPEIRRVYGSVDGLPDFDDHPEHLWFVWQESPAGYATGGLVVMNFAGFSTTLAGSVYAWLPCIAVNPEDPMHLVVTAWSYPAGGNQWAYCWISEDGGYTWTDTIPMCEIDADGSCGHLRFGQNGYLFYTYHDTYDWHGTEIIYPYYLESIDGGYTWSAETPLPEVPLLAPQNCQFWWHEMDCEVINGEPWAVHNDLNQNPDLSDMWVFHGTGSPGNWAWDIIQVGLYGNFTYTNAGITYVYSVGQYPSISVDYLNGDILVGYKGHCIEYTSSDTIANGAHVAGIYAYSDGTYWTPTLRMSVPNDSEIVWLDWNGTEIAHRGFHWDIAQFYSNSIWVHEAELNLYYDGGEPLSIEEFSQEELKIYNLRVTPSIGDAFLSAVFTIHAEVHVKLSVYDATGRCVDTCFEGYLDKGMHNVAINTQNLSNGTYFVVLESSSQKQVAKFVVAQ